MPTRVGRASPGLSEERNGRIERRDNGPGGGTDGAGEVSPGPNPLHKLGYLLHYSLSSAGFVTALSDCFQSGGRFPASGVIAFNPTRPSHAQLAGEMPPLREGDRYFWAARAGAATCYYLLPCAQVLLKSSSGIMHKGKSLRTS